MTMSVAVIGAGWYGCHIALSLMRLGFEVAVFEQNGRPLHEASGNNQFRLHVGFHYPRHYGTRSQSRDGFMRFVERYPSLVRDVDENIYGVPADDSSIDFATYRLIMTGSGLDFREVQECSVPLTDLSGLLLVREKVLLTDRARRYFAQHLGNSLQLNCRIEDIEESTDSIRVNGRRFDIVVDATWGHRAGLPITLFYEPTLLLYYEVDGPFPAITLVDGPLCSIYPTEDPGLYTLSSVPHTPLGRFTMSSEARRCRDTLSADTVAKKRVLMEEQITRYVPGFKDRFRYLGPQFSIKTKPIGKADDRSCYVFQQGRVFSVMSGKIDTIFTATERILSTIQSKDLTGSALTTSLRQDILSVLVA